MAYGDANTAQATTSSQVGIGPTWRDQYRSQLNPAINQAAYNYGRGSEADYGNYTDIMNQYRNIATGNYPGAGASGGGAAGYTGDMSYLTSPGTYTPFNINYDDPFKSYQGYQNFSQTGGYSPQDVANLRARGTAPIRASYANAQREISRQRALGGGYAPNAVSALSRMAREQGQGMADAMQNVEGGIVNQRNANMLSGLGGMQGIEGQRLSAQLAANEFNAQQQAAAQQGNIGSNWALQQANSAIQGRNLSAQQAAANAGASAAAAGSQNDVRNRLAALGGMTNLYGTTPAQAATFGNQLFAGIGQGGNYDVGMYNAMQGAAQNQMRAGQLPSNFDTTMNRIGQFAPMVYPFLQGYGNRNQNPQQNQNQQNSYYYGNNAYPGPTSGYDYPDASGNYLP